ncbi:MAG: hypothetical protein AAFW98_06050 [Pseudomonadota bacterium]
MRGWVGLPQRDGRHHLERPARHLIRRAVALQEGSPVGEKLARIAQRGLARRGERKGVGRPPHELHADGIFQRLELAAH